MQNLEQLSTAELDALLDRLLRDVSLDPDGNTIRAALHILETRYRQLHPLSEAERAQWQELLDSLLE